MKNQNEEDADSSLEPSGNPNLALLLNRMNLVGLATGGLLVVAVLFSLDIAAAFFIPIILAHLFDRLLSPVVRWAQDVGIPAPFGAAIVIVVIVGGLGVGGYYLSGPASEWIESAPKKMRIAEYKLRGVTEPLEKIKEAAKEVDKATGGQENGQNTVQVEQEQSVGAMLMSQTREFISGLLIMIFLLYFLLATGDLLLRKIVGMLPQLHQRKNAVRIIRSIEADLSRYLGMIFLVNIGLGVAVAAAMYLIGMPNPILWGALAGILNFIPYLGPVINITIVGLVALVSFESVAHALLAPLAYLLLNGIEASLVTPTVLGWRLKLNPVVIFIALTFWTWIWGILGGLLAVPLLATTKIICDKIEVLRPIGELLGQ